MSESVYQPVSQQPMSQQPMSQPMSQPMPEAHPASQPSAVASELDPREMRLFRSLDVEGRGSVRVGDLLAVFDRAGLRRDDGRIHQTLRALGRRGLREKLDFQAFCESVRPDMLIVEQALQGSLVIPDFEDFAQTIDGIFETASSRDDGRVADYIPQLAQVNPDQFGVSICTIDGQFKSLGDSKVDFCVQSCTKPISYGLALEDHGEAGVHQFVGREPSGRNFNELALSEDGLPHNPMINSGAIMSTSLIRPDLDPGARFDYVIDRWRALCGERKPGFNNPVYQSERKTADRNYALGYYMRENRAFPPDTDLLETLEFYFQTCAIEVNAEMMSVVAATLANGGVCPTTGERVLKTSNVRHILTLMSSCGMYDSSGDFAFEVGLPAKSGVSGVVMVVIPNVMGVCIWSPRLDSHGNSVRGLEFCRRLVQEFNFHNYDSLTGFAEKADPRRTRIETQAEEIDQLIWAASKGDLGAVHRLVVKGHDQNAADYDLRTPLHLAAAEGRMNVVEYLVENDANTSPKDRWGGTPLDDAMRHGHDDVAEWLVDRGGECASHQVAAGCVARTCEVSDSGPRGVVEMIYAASEGNLPAVQRLVARGVALDVADYDLRTPVHLAAAEGHEELVQYFVDQGVELAPRDRWGGTPLDDARRHGHLRVAHLLGVAPEHRAENARLIGAMRGMGTVTPLEAHRG